MQLFDAEGRRLYFTEEERRAFLAAAAKAPREVRTFCGTLHATGCRISEALAFTARQIDLSGRVVVFESLKKRQRGVFRAVPVPPELLDTLDMVHGIREAQRRGGCSPRCCGSSAGCGRRRRRCEGSSRRTEREATGGVRLDGRRPTSSSPAAPAIHWAGRLRRPLRPHWIATQGPTDGFCP